jgi:tetratricopeptide (TPR) repeat protein/predicted Ser/Thr protein kinase
MPQDLVAHYRLKQRLGRGAMGEVWLAEDTKLHRLVALKMLPVAEQQDEAAGDLLLREARVASALNHPNVAVVYDVGKTEAGGRATGFIAMEYVRGRTLTDLLKDGRMEASAVIPIAHQVAEALADAHDHGVVHRDVKPGNVMVTERGLVKVLDFGLARFAPPAGEDSATWSGAHGALEGALVGTLAYMSPEQARGLSIDGRSDVFSLGVVLYELMAGRRPFDGTNAVQQIDALLTREPPPFAVEGPLATGLARLVGRMLEKDPGRRPADMRAVLSELDALVAGRAPAPSPEPDHVVAVLGFANITARPEDDWLGTGLAETVAAGLGTVPGLVVVSRERVIEVLRALSLPASPDDSSIAARVGREVGARGVVSGGYQCLGGQVRVTARVTETDGGRVRVSHKVDGSRDSIFELQDRLVAGLVGGLRGSGPPAELRPEDTQNLEAFELFSKGLLNLQMESQESIDRAIVFFEHAVALDPAYARAHMHLGAALDLKGDYLTTPELAERGLAELDRAIALRPEYGDAWRYRGSALITLGRAAEATSAYERALALNPTDAAAHAGLARVRFILEGDFAGAATSYERALALNPRAGWAALQLAHCTTLLREFPRAEAAARRAVDLQRSFLSGRTGLVIVGAHMRLGQVFALQGRHRDALEEYGRELEFVKSVDHALRARLFIELNQRIGEAHFRLGEADAAAAALDLSIEAWERRARTGANDAMSPYYAACAYALRGEAQPALACLERAASRRPRLTAARAAIEPALEPLRGAPRFRALLAAGSSPGPPSAPDAATPRAAGR